MTDPTKLYDEADASERALLDSLRADEPSEELRGAMWKTIAAQAGIASSAAIASSASATTTSLVPKAVLTKALAAKVALAIALGTTGAVVWQQVREEPRSVQVAPAAPKAALTAKVEPPIRAPVIETCEEASNCEPPAAPPAPPRKKKKRVSVSEPAPARPAVDALRAESKLLAEARSQLRTGQLAAAEQTLNRARDAFPEGSLGQEREVLQIELLAALGDSEGADHRARRFLRKHPDSPHVKSVRRFVIAP
jgi:hypothetical protein